MSRANVTSIQKAASSETKGECKNFKSLWEFTIKTDHTVGLQTEH